MFLTSFDSESGGVLGISLDRKTGQVLWKHSLGEGKSENAPGMENYMACPSPVTDGSGDYLFANVAPGAPKPKDVLEDTFGKAALWLERFFVMGTSTVALSGPQE